MARLGRSQPIQPLYRRAPLIAAPSTTPDLRANALGNDGQTVSSTTLSITIPADAATDGTEYAIVTIDELSTVALSSAPTGWSLLSGPDSAGGVTQGYLYGKAIAPGEPGTTVTWTWANFVFAVGHMAVYKNVNPTGKIVATPNVDATSGTTIDLPSVGSVPAGALVHVHFALTKPSGGGSPDVTTPSGYSAGTSPRSAGTGGLSGHSVEHAYKVTSTAGTYGGETASIDASALGTVYIVALPSSSTTVAIPDLATSTPTAYAPTVTPGAITVVPDLVASTPATYAPTVTATLTVVPDLATSTPAVYAPDVTTPLTVTPGVAASTPQTYAPTVTGSLTVVPDAATSTPDVYAPTVTAGAVTVIPDVATSSPAIYDPVVIIVPTPSHIVGTAVLETQTLGTAVLAGNGLSTAVLAAQTLGTASVTYTPGTATIDTT